jgi:hypothetical protein
MQINSKRPTVQLQIAAQRTAIRRMFAHALTRGSIRGRSEHTYVPASGRCARRGLRAATSRRPGRRRTPGQRPPSSRSVSGLYRHPTPLFVSHGTHRSYAARSRFSARLLHTSTPGLYICTRLSAHITTTPYIGNRAHVALTYRRQS